MPPIVICANSVIYSSCWFDVSKKMEEYFYGCAYTLLCRLLQRWGACNRSTLHSNFGISKVVLCTNFQDFKLVLCNNERSSKVFEFPSCGGSDPTRLWQSGYGIEGVNWFQTKFALALEKSGCSSCSLASVATCGWFIQPQSMHKPRYIETCS